MEAPLFPMIVGSPRSGTTLLRAMLDSHPELAIFHEAEFLSRLASRRRYETANGFAVGPFLDDLCKEPTFIRSGLNRSVVEETLNTAAPKHYSDAMRAVFSAYATSRGKPRYGDKTPMHVRRMVALSTLFPEARFLHIIRDGRDVALSLIDHHLWPPRTVWEAAVYWREFVDLGKRDGQSLGRDRYHEIRYEDLVASPDEALREVCKFLALPFSQQVLDYSNRVPEILVGTMHPNVHNQRLQLPPTENLRKWQEDMSRVDQGVFQKLSSPTLQAFGYPILAFSARERATVQMRLLYFRFRNINAMLWRGVIRRVRNLARKA